MEKGFAGEHYDNSAHSLESAAAADTKCPTQSNLGCAGLRESKPLNHHLLGKIAFQTPSIKLPALQLARLPSPIDGFRVMIENAVNNCVHISLMIIVMVRGYIIDEMINC